MSLLVALVVVGIAPALFVLAAMGLRRVSGQEQVVADPWATAVLAILSMAWGLGFVVGGWYLWRAQPWRRVREVADCRTEPLRRGPVRWWLDAVADAGRALQLARAVADRRSSDLELHRSA